MKDIKTVDYETFERSFFENWMCENEYEYDNIPIEELLVAYFKAKVESISDEEIEKSSEAFINNRNKFIWERGAKWFKNKLLNDL